MPGIARLRFIDNVGGGLIIGPGSISMRVDGAPVAFVGDMAASHGSNRHAVPKLIMVGAAVTMRVDGRIPAMRGTLATCGHPVIPGSSSMIIR